MIWSGIQELVSRAKAGEADAWGRLHALVQSYLRQLAGQVLGPGWPDRSAQDLVQGTWLKAVEKLQTFRGGADDAATSALLRAWLKRILKNAHANAVRDGQAGKRRPPPGAPAVTGPEGVDVPADDPSPSHNANLSEQWQRVRAAVAALPDETDREIMRRHFFQGTSLTDIGKALGLSLDKVRRRYHNSLEHLRARLESLL